MFFIFGVGPKTKSGRERVNLPVPFAATHSSI